VLADSKKAEDIIVLDMRKLTFITDFFVICTSRSPRQSMAIAQELETELKNLGIKKMGSEFDRRARWLLQDFGNVVIHIVSPDARRFYSLDTLWLDASRIRWQKKQR
jgi:ribosome-associated protein